ncbi:hypothetical protein MRX96_003917 [Rhipicephalus microplus]
MEISAEPETGRVLSHASLHASKELGARRARLVRCAGAEDGPQPACLAHSSGSFRTQERASHQPAAAKAGRRGPLGHALSGALVPARRFDSPPGAVASSGSTTLVPRLGGSPDHWSVPRTAPRLGAPCSSESASSPRERHTLSSPDQDLHHRTNPKRPPSECQPRQRS